MAIVTLLCLSLSYHSFNMKKQIDFCFNSERMGNLLVSALVRVFKSLKTSSVKDLNLASSSKFYSSPLIKGSEVNNNASYV